MLSFFCQTDQRSIAPCQVLEVQQYGEHPFELAVEAHLVAAMAFQLAGIERLAECLLADQEPVRQVLLPGLEPRQHLRFEEAAQAIDISGDEFLVLLQFVGVVS